MSSKKKTNKSTEKKKKEDCVEKSYGEQLKQAMLITPIVSEFNAEQNINASILEYLLADDQTSLENILRRQDRQSIKGVVSRFIVSKISHFLQTLIKMIESKPNNEYCYAWIAQILCLHPGSIDKSSIAKLKEIVDNSYEGKMQLLSLSGKIQLLTA